MASQRAHILGYPSLVASSHQLVLADEARDFLYRSLAKDAEERPEAQFKVGDVIESPYGLREVTRMYCRMNNQYQDEWRYETKLVTDGTIDCVYTRDWRTFKESQLVEWNPGGAYAEILVAVSMVVDDPVPQLVGNTMDTLLLPARIDDLRCVARDVLEILPFLGDKSRYCPYGSIKL